MFHLIVLFNILIYSVLFVLSDHTTELLRAVCEKYQLTSLHFTVCKKGDCTHFKYDYCERTMVKCSSLGEPFEVAIATQTSPHAYIAKTLGSPVSAPGSIHLFDGRKLKDFRRK